MGILLGLRHRLRWQPEEEPQDQFYLGHHRRLKKVDQTGHHSRCIRFPVCLAVQHGEELPVIYEDFSLNLIRRVAFIESETPLPKGSELILHLYIPPEKKLLAEFKGEVIATSSDAHLPHGMEISLYEEASDSLRTLEDYLDGHRRLLDQVG